MRFAALSDEAPLTVDARSRSDSGVLDAQLQGLLTFTCKGNGNAGCNRYGPRRGKTPYPCGSRGGKLLVNISIPFHLIAVAYQSV